MMAEYELTLLLKEDEAKHPQDDRVNAFFVIKNKENGGRKLLAYPINEDGKTYEYGYFVYYDLVKRDDAENYFLTRLLDNDQDVLRYMLLPKRKV